MNENNECIRLASASQDGLIFVGGFYDFCSVESTIFVLVYFIAFSFGSFFMALLLLSTISYDEGRTRTVVSNNY